MLHPNHVENPTIELESQISQIGAITKRLSGAPSPDRERLRWLFADLARLKAQRTALQIYRIEAQKGILL